eukprot:SAG11_NODE_183_length_13181_cov_4.027672_2_plen_129_part_00
MMLSQQASSRMHHAPRAVAMRVYQEPTQSCVTTTDTARPVAEGPVVAVGFATAASSSFFRVRSAEEIEEARRVRLAALAVYKEKKKKRLTRGLGVRRPNPDARYHNPLRQKIARDRPRVNGRFVPKGG